MGTGSFVPGDGDGIPQSLTFPTPKRHCVCNAWRLDAPRRFLQGICMTTSPLRAPPPRRGQAGLTLIELMTVMAIIGVLAAVGIPLYKDHATRASLTSAIATLSAIRPNIESHILANGTFPNGTAASTAHTTGQTLADLGIVSPRFGTISFVHSQNGTKPGIALEFTSGNLDIKHKKVMLLRDDGTGAWSCSTTVDKRHAGKLCDAEPTSTSTPASTEAVAGA